MSSFKFLAQYVSAVADILNVGIGNGGRHVWAHGTFANNATTLAKVNDLVQAAFSNVSTKDGNFTFSNVFQPVSKTITRKAATNGGNVLGLDPADEYLICGSHHIFIGG